MIFLDLSLSFTSHFSIPSFSLLLIFSALPFLDLKCLTMKNIPIPIPIAPITEHITTIIIVLLLFLFLSFFSALFINIKSFNLTKYISFPSAVSFSEILKENVLISLWFSTFKSHLKLAF